MPLSATMCSSSWPVRIGTASPRLSRALRGVTSCPDRADSHAKRAPARRSARALRNAAGSRRTRYSSIARAARGWVAARNGSTYTSLSAVGAADSAAPRPRPEQWRSGERAQTAPRAAARDRLRSRHRHPPTATPTPAGARRPAHRSRPPARAEHGRVRRGDRPLRAMPSIRRDPVEHPVRSASAQVTVRSGGDRRGLPRHAHPHEAVILAFLASDSGRRLERPGQSRSLDRPPRPD